MIRVNVIIYFFLLLFGCGGLSEQQANSQKLRDGLEDHQIKRVTDDQIIAGAHKQGNYLVSILEQRSTDIQYWQTSSGRVILDSINQAMEHHGMKLIPLVEPSMDLSPEESSLIEAYQYSLENRQTVHENVQKVNDNFLLFTAPLTYNGEFSGMWSFQLSRKSVIRGL